MKTLFACLGSGNCFKPWLTMEQLQMDFELKLVDLLAGEHKKPEYLRVNPLGVVPFLQDDGAVEVGESNAMIWYLAEGSYLMPDNAPERAQALQWMFFEQSKLEPFISPARFFTTIVPDQRAAHAQEILLWQEKAKPGLRYLDAHLSGRDFVLNSGYSIADIALFGYVHVLAEAGLTPSEYPNIINWIDNVSQTERFKPLVALGARLDKAA